MPKLVKDGVIAENTWTLLEKSEEAANCDLPAGQIIVPLNVWQAQKASLASRADVGVWIDSDESAHDLGEDAKDLPLVAVNFPGFMDGRAFSTARLLRERYGFTGELRAVGHFMRDQLCYLSRCGVNAFAFASDETDLTEVMKSLNDFTEFYQASVNQPVPLFRRRTA